MCRRPLRSFLGATLIIFAVPLFAQSTYAKPKITHQVKGLSKKTHHQTFFKALKPYAKEALTAVQTQRKQLIHLHTQWQTSRFLAKNQKVWLQNLAHSYHLNMPQVHNPLAWKQLLMRVDIVPTGLLLAQAAIESAYGKSRFAHEANNYFGQWCFHPGCGLVPEKRPAGRTYEVAKFSSPEASVRAYIQNLNTNSHYQNFRTMRATMRAQHQPLSAWALAATLSKYSQRGEAYVKLIREMIQDHKLAST